MTMKRKIPIVLVCACVLAPAATGGGAAAAHARRQRTLVYSSRRPGLNVSITRRGERIIRAAIGGRGLCENGERPGVGFELLGGSGIRVHPNGVFDDTRGVRSYLKGRLEGDKVIGFFRESFTRDVTGEERPVVCGNVTPRGRNQRFVAHLSGK